MTTLPQSTLYSMLMLWASHNVSDLKAPVLPCCDSKQFRPCEQALAHILQTISEALLAIITQSVAEHDSPCAILLLCHLHSQVSFRTRSDRLPCLQCLQMYHCLQN